MIHPGATLGVLGGGQLGRMFAQAAQRLGYRVQIFEPQGPCPAGEVAAHEVNAAYTDAAALREFVAGCAAVTYEFENIPAGPLQALGPDLAARLAPRPEVLHVCQNRQREKAWLRAHGFPHVTYAEALDGDVAKAVASTGLPAVVKTADFGYDGKGQMKLATPDDLAVAAAKFRGHRVVVERWCEFTCEISVVVARSATGEVRVFPVTENIHTNHILDLSVVPARVAPAIAAAAQDLAQRIATALGVVGLIAVEMFVTTAGEVLVNELAPRPHNSGHWTMDGCVTSQFEQHVRAVCGLPLGDVSLLAPAAAMVNVLGDVWPWVGDTCTGEPDWAAALRCPRAKLHLYGKREPRPGRKMGHINVTAESADAALAAARAAKGALLRAGRG